MTYEEQAEELFERGSDKELKGEYSAALIEHEKAVKLQPFDIRYINAAAILTRTLGMYEESAMYFQKKLVLINADLGKNHSLAKQVQGDLDRVIIDALKAGGK
ncbi:MAG: hypothetical protein GY810_01250 [Aureispira sp.]|nr:hypothetical protein [Aureispira sp.]